MDSSEIKYAAEYWVLNFEGGGGDTEKVDEGFAFYEATFAALPIEALYRNEVFGFGAVVGNGG